MNRHEFELTAKKFRAGKISLADFANAVYGENSPERVSATQSPVPPLPERPKDSHKGTYGKVLVIGGSNGMAGAPALSASAALRSGSGLVTLAIYKDCQTIAAGLNPCVMTCDVTDVKTSLGEFNSIAIGPGFGTGPQSISTTLHVYQYAKCPVVIDADALNCLAIESIDLKKHAGPRVMTPHPGEFQRLFPEVSQNRQSMELAATQYCQKHDLTIVLKGPNTLVTDGETEYRNQSGNSGMATAGSGDVLTGVIAGLAGQGMNVFDAARLAVYLHGLAGDLAAKKVGLHSLIATDLINFLPDAFCKHAKS